MDTLSHPWAVFTFRFFIIKFISSLFVITFSDLLLVLNSKDGSIPLLITGIHREAKYELNSASFLAEFVVYLVFFAV